MFKKWEFLLSPNSEKLYEEDYLFFYRYPMGVPKNLKEKFIYDEAEGDRNRRRKKSLDEFKVWWRGTIGLYFAQKCIKDAGPTKSR